MSTNLPIIAINIRKIRKKNNLSQDKLSKLANVAFHTITKIESGDTSNPTIETVKKIANALKIDINKLIK